MRPCLTLPWYNLSHISNTLYVSVLVDKCTHKVKGHMAVGNKYRQLLPILHNHSLVMEHRMLHKTRFHRKIYHKHSFRLSKIQHSVTTHPHLKWNLRSNRTLCLHTRPLALQQAKPDQLRSTSFLVV